MTLSLLKGYGQLRRAAKYLPSEIFILINHETSKESGKDRAKRNLAIELAQCTV
jgi:hypothetical protein